MAEVLVRVLRFNAIESVQEGVEKPLAGQRIDGAMATFGTDLPLTNDWAILGECLHPCQLNIIDTDEVYIRQIRKAGRDLASPYLIRIGTEAGTKLKECAHLLSLLRPSIDSGGRQRS